MIRKIIRIDAAKCNGCSLCAKACHEGAIAMVNGKASLIREDYCDGLGDCLPVCPTGAISFEEREAQAFCCPVSPVTPIPKHDISAEKTKQADKNAPLKRKQWPLQIKLIPENAPFFNGARLLIAADCTAYAYASFHEDFLSGRIALIGCPKLDEGNYTEKLSAIFRGNAIKDITVVRMEVPCCSGIENAVMRGLENSGKRIPWQVVTISTDGRVLESKKDEFSR